MKITTKNYIKAINKVGFENLPEVLKNSHLVMMAKTDDGKDWSFYENNADAKRVFDLVFSKLEEFMDGKSGLSGIDENTRAKEDAKNYPLLETEQLKRIYRLELDAELEEDGTPEERKIRKTALEKELKKRDVKWLAEFKSDKSVSGKEIEYDPIKEIQFIERFLAFRDQMVRKNTIKMFIDDLQKAILEKKIRKHSPYAKQITRLQNVSIQFYNRADQVNRLILSKELLNDLYSVILDMWRWN